MPKRSHSPEPLPPAKRLHTSEFSRPHSFSLFNFDNSLYDELMLCIFSHLSWIDLCVTQPTSRNWARLAGDNELWKIQYLQEYGRTRLRGSKGFIARLDGREVKPLPGRAKSDQFKDWKWMFRISSNWRRGVSASLKYKYSIFMPCLGRCVVEEAGEPMVDLQSALQPATYVPNVSGDGSVHLVLAGPLTITASSQPFEQPPISIIQHAQRHTLICEPSQPGVVRITALALDQSPPSSGNLTIACFLSSGEFSVYDFNASSPTPVSKRLTYQPPRRSSRSSNIIRAVYYHPLVITLADTFSLSIYDLSSNNVRLTQTLSAFTSYPPASLVLSSPTRGQFKLVVAYSTPVYPRHWSVGVTELMISSTAAEATSSSHAGSSTSASFKEEFRYPLASSMNVTMSRTIRAFDVPNGWVDIGALNAMREQWGRKVLNVAAAQTDGKWVVLAPGDGYGRSFASCPPTSSSPRLHSSTSLQLYRLVLPVQSNSISASPPKLNFVRTLHGQTSPVWALALADGRCVSLGENGSIWVWDLEAGTGAEVAPPDEAMTDPALQSMRGTVSFDERKIVSARAGKVVVHRFDI